MKFDTEQYVKIGRVFVTKDENNECKLYIINKEDGKFVAHQISNEEGYSTENLALNFILPKTGEINKNKIININKYNILTDADKALHIDGMHAYNLHEFTFKNIHHTVKYRSLFSNHIIRPNKINIGTLLWLEKELNKYLSEEKKENISNKR